MLALNRPMLLYCLLNIAFVTALVVANMMGAYLLQVPLLGGGQQLISAGILAFPLTFLLTDLVNEFYGQKGAQWMTAMGFIATILTFGWLALGQVLPQATATVMSHSAYMEVSSQYMGMFIASLTAYVIGQVLDISLFGFFKKMTRSKMIWLRATGSTLVSQLFDSYIVGLIAFWGDLPLQTILQIGTGNYWVKFAVAIAITPVLYLGHFALKQLLKKHLPQRELS
jgi:queuosine precursor transporter